MVNRNGGGSRSGGEPHVNKWGAEMGVNPAEATHNKCGAGKARPDRTMSEQSEDNHGREKRRLEKIQILLHRLLF